MDDKKKLRVKLGQCSLVVLNYVSDLEMKIDAYKECFEQFIPIDKWDEATRFLSTYKNGLVKDFEKKERL